MLAGSCVGIPCPPYIEFIRRSEKAVGVRTTQRLESHQFVGGLEGFMYSETKWRENRADAILITCQIYAERAIVANTRRCVNILDGGTYFVCGIGEHWDCRKGNFTSLIEEGSVDQANVGVFNVSIANVWTIPVMFTTRSVEDGEELFCLRDKEYIKDIEEVRRREKLVQQFVEHLQRTKNCSLDV